MFTTNIRFALSSPRPGPGNYPALCHVDFCKSSNHFFQRLQLFILKFWCSFWGMVLHGNPEMHTYIAASLDCFPDREQLLALIDENRSIVSHSQHFLVFWSYW